MGDEVHLPARVLALGLLELLSEAEAGSLQIAVRLLGAVRTAVGRVREVPDLVVAVAEGAGIEAERRLVRRSRGVDSTHGQEELREITRREETLRVDVPVAEAHSEMEPLDVVLGSGAPRGADDLAALDAVPRSHADPGEERIRRAEVAVVRDDYMQRARDRP